MRQTLFLLLGYPGSGKSTFSKQLSTVRDIIRVNSDELRRYMYDDIEAIRNTKNNPAVFGALDYVTEQLLSAGKSVLYDANNNRRRDRIASQKLAAKYDADIIIIWVKTPLETAKQREGERALEKNYVRIPAERYKQLIERLQEPEASERVIVIDGLLPFAEQLQSFDAQLANITLGGRTSQQ